MYLIDEIDRVQTTRRFGRVAAINGLLVELSGAEFGPGIGSRVRIRVAGGETVMAEVVGFREDRVLCMPFAELVGVAPGARADLEEGTPALFPGTGWIGRIVNAFGEPIDGAGPLMKGPAPYPYRSSPPAAHLRKRVGAKIDLGVRSLNTFASCCRGQRLGIFAGSGVGKSVLLSMLARYTEADAIIIGLIGERGREVREFIQDDLGPDGLARSIVVVATSDETALARRQAAFTTLALAEFLRDQGLHVLCLIDSITRFAMAQREIGLSAGEPPTTKGYTPTVFAELPKLLERAGPGAEGSGDITGLFTVLVDGDDHNEPIADAVRGILDGHIVMERKIAERGRYPAINVLKSVSRTMPGCNTPEQQAIVREAKAHMSTYEDMADLIRLGAYRAGSNAEVDRAIELNPSLEAFLTQMKTERTSLSDGYRRLGEILGHVEAPPPAPAAPARRRR